MDEEKTNFFPVKDLIRQIRGGNTSIKRKSCIARFQEAYIEVLKSYYICNVKPEEAYNNFLNTKTVRDIYLEFVETIAETESNYAETLAESFEYLYNKLIHRHILQIRMIWMYIKFFCGNCSSVLLLIYVILKTMRQ